MTDAELYALLRRGEWLWPEDHLDELSRAFENTSDRPVRKGLPILSTGYVPEPFGVLEALDAAGLYIAADDYAAVGRRIVRNGANGSVDAWEALLSRYFALPPCPTRGSDQERRMRHLESLAARAGVRGVLVHVQKFCEPELFDVAAIRRTFALRGIPVLVLEGELEPELSAQAVTRIEAFAEMLHARGA